MTRLRVNVALVAAWLVFLVMLPCAVICRVFGRAVIGLDRLGTTIIVWGIKA